MRCILLICVALLVIGQCSVFGEVERALVISNSQPPKDEKPAHTEVRSASSEVISADQGEQTNSELIKEKGESLMKLPKVFNQPRDNESSNQQAAEKALKGRARGKKGGRVKGKVLDSSPNPDVPVEPEYEDDDDDYDEYFAHQLDKLQDQNNQYNAPIMPPAEQLNQPGGSLPYSGYQYYPGSTFSYQRPISANPPSSGYHYPGNIAPFQPPATAFQPPQNDYKPPSVSFVTEDVNAPSIAKPTDQQTANQPAVKPFKGEASFIFDSQTDPVVDKGFISDSQYAGNHPPTNGQVDKQPAILPTNEPATGQPTKPFKGEASLNFDESTDTLQNEAQPADGEQQTSGPLIDGQVDWQSPADQPSDKQVGEQPDANQPSDDQTREQSVANQPTIEQPARPVRPFNEEAYFTIDYGTGTNPTEAPLPNNPDSVVLPYSPSYYTPPLPSPAYNPNDLNDPNNPNSPYYQPNMPTDSIAESPDNDLPADVQITTVSPTDNGLSLDGHGESNSGSDFIDEAAKLSNKIGYQPPANEDNDSEGLGEEPHGTDNKAESDAKLVVPSVYQMFKEKTKQPEQQPAVDNPTLKVNIDTEPSNEPLPSLAVLNPKPTNRIMNESPKIVIAKPASSFPAMDLFRRSCAIKINGFAALGICRPSCGPKEVGIQVKLKESCTSYQLTCDSPFEICCVPNLSENGACNVDLFKPNEIIARVEKSLNLPQSSLIKLSHLQPAFIESIINYRAPTYFTPQTPAFKDRLSNYYRYNEVYDPISRPSIHYAKKADAGKRQNELRSLKDENDDMAYLERDQLDNHFETISNQVPKANPAQVRYAKVLRRVDNPILINHKH